MPRNTNPRVTGKTDNPKTNPAPSDSSRGRGDGRVRLRKSNRVEAGSAPAPVLYNLQLTAGQCGVVMAACEFFSRIHMGQFEEITRRIFNPLYRKGAKNWQTPEVDEAEGHLRRAKHLLTGLEHAYYSIGSPDVPDKGKIAMEIRDVIRHHLAYERNPGGGMTVDFNTPMLWSGKEPLAKIERVGVAQLDKSTGRK